jgi:hypothetical protein
MLLRSKNIQKIISFFSYALVANIFFGSLILSKGLFDLYLNILFILPFLAFCFLYFRRLSINKTLLSVALLVCIPSVLNIFLGNNSTILFFKIFGGFVFYGTAYYFLFRLNRNKVERLFIIYLRIAYVVALIGIFQEISYLVGFKLGHDYSLFLPNIRCQGTTLGLLQVTSILQEPSHLGSVMAPAVFVALFNIIGRKNYLMDKKASWLILICTLLSFSLVAYLGIIIIFILLMLNYKKVKTIVLASIAVAFLAVCAYVALSNIRLRVNDTAAILCGKKTIDQVNLSTLAFYGNGFVAYKSVMNNPVFGAGLGSHPVSYDRYIPELIEPSKIAYGYGLNKEDACGLFFRIASETGLLGLFVFSFFMFKFYVSKKKNEYFWIVSNALLVLFLLVLIRQGNYFYNGFIFFVWAYYFTHRNMLRQQIKDNNDDLVPATL